MHQGMVRLVAEVGVKAALALGGACLFTLLSNPLRHFSENRTQTVVVLGFYIYCVLTLATPSRHKLFHVLSIPTLTQFLHLFQKYDFPPGANSVWRLLPFF